MGPDEDSPLINGEKSPHHQLDIFWSILRTLYACVTYAAMIVLLVIWGTIAPNFSWFYSLTWAVGFVPWFAIAFLLSRYVFNKERSLLDGSRPILTQSLFASFLLAINYWGVSVANPKVPGPVQVILGQIPTAFAIIFSWLILKRKYSAQCWIGGTLVIVGSLIPMIRAFLQTEGAQYSAGYIILFIVGNLPLGFLPINYEGFHKAKGSDGKQITLEYRMLVTNFLLIFWLWLFLPLFIALDQPPVHQFSDNLNSAFGCVFIGRNSVNWDTNHCDLAGWILLATIIVAGAQLHSQVVLARGDTGAYAQIALTLAPFLADIIFPIRKLMDPFGIPSPTYWDAISAIICVVGVVLFSIYDFRDRHKYARVEDSAFIKWFLKENWGQ